MPPLKQTIIKNFMSHYGYKQDAALFALKVLQGMSSRTLENFDKEALNKLINTSFLFFKENAPKNKTHFRIRHKTKKNGKRFSTLEIACPDANQLLLTIEALIDSLNLRITRKLHPVFDMLSDGKTQTFCDKKKKGSHVYSYIYIAFLSHLDQEATRAFKEKLRFHLKAIFCIEQDRKQSLQAIDEAIATFQKSPQSQHAITEWHALLTWLRSANFSFFGFKNKDLSLGLCSTHYKKIDPNITAMLKKASLSKTPFSFTQVNYISPVYRFENLMCLKLYDETTKSSTYCFGLLRRSSMITNNLETPIIRKKIQYIFSALDVKTHSYNYSEIVRIFVQIPKFELFRTSKEALLEMVENILSVTNPNHIQCFFKKHYLHKKHFLMVIMPPFLFSKRNIKILLNDFKTQYAVKHVEHIAIPGVELCRLHLYFKEAPSFHFVEEHFERSLGDRLKSMEDKLHDYIEEHIPAKEALYIQKNYVPFIPYHYQVRSHPKDLFDDLMAIDALHEQKNVSFRCMPFTFPTFSDLAGKASLLKIYSLSKMDLIHIIPILENCGLYVIDQLTARIGTKAETKGFIQSFRIQTKTYEKIDDPSIKQNMETLLEKLYTNQFENDPLNALVLSGFDHQQISLFLMYRNYFLQCDPSYSAEHINYALCHYPTCTQHLFDWFDTRFNPSLRLSKEKREQRCLKLETVFQKSLQDVSYIEHDFSFRQLFYMLKATLRCNYYQHTIKALAIKVNPEHIPICPKPTPFKEMFVYNHSLEGVHLRFGPIARGGLRFSDRNFDFRREILLLAQTQRAKNVVIVPNGAKGGFIIKQEQKPERETIANNYEDFIQTLLSITDNRSPNGKKESPKACVIYDDFDPYFVVAADKGTATFSDLANNIAKNQHFWLDDAFASGGSKGYDHKKYGITAKGAWECLRQHIQEHGFKKDHILTCVGIGDMGGDVFGNGLIESKQLKLLAAFNHIHIFIDPNPDPLVSWKERKRLFQKPRSTWKDYKPLSTGGGVFDRASKSIPLTQEIKALFGLNKTHISGPALIREILKLHVDFIWFGGIGTYIKSEAENHLEIGDQNNDSVRVNANEIKAAIIAEGANSGISMPARINLSSFGIRLNTDAIDNSAGVSMSDYEVNLKIFAKLLMDKKKITSQKQRDDLLFNIDKEVTGLVLNTNQEQHRLISLEQLRSKKNKQSSLLALVKHLVAKDILHLKEEQLPSVNQLEKWARTNTVFPRPLIAVIQAYVKQLAYDELQESNMIEKPLFVDRFKQYFPQTIQHTYAKELLDHPLKKAITALQMVNETINYAGVSFLHEQKKMSGKSSSEIIEMVLFVSDLTHVNVLRKDILDSQASPEAKYACLLEINHPIEKMTRIFLSNPFFDFIKPIDLASYTKLFKALQSAADRFFCPSPIAYKKMGFELDLAKKISKNTLTFFIPEILYLSIKKQIPMHFISDLIFEASPILGFDWLENQLEAFGSTIYWDTLQKQTLSRQMTTLKIQLLYWIYSLNKKKTLTHVSFDQRLQSCHPTQIKLVKNYFNHLSKLKQHPNDIHLTSLSVCIQQLEELCYSIITK